MTKSERDVIAKFMARAGRKGGTARAANLTQAQRSEAASNAARARVYPASCACGKCPTCTAREYQRERRKNKVK